jgi:Zn-dependent protease
VNRDDTSPSRWQRLLNASWPVVRTFGVEVRVGWTVLLLPFVLFALFRLPSRYDTDGILQGWDGITSAELALALTAALYAASWFHEMAHAWVGRRFGVLTRVIRLSPAGALGHAEPPIASSRARMWTALAGPFAQVALVVLLGIPFLIANLDVVAETQEWARVCQWFLVWQAALLVLNLAPAWPLDGGRFLRGALSRVMHEGKASFWTAQIGLAAALVFAILGGGVLYYGMQGHLALHVCTGAVLVLVGVNGFLASRHLHAVAPPIATPFEAKASWIPAPVGGPGEDSIAESSRLARAEQRRERRAADARRQEEEHRQRLQERIDELLDRINEVGGVENLSADERRELAEASETLSREPVEG